MGTQQTSPRGPQAKFPLLALATGTLGLLVGLGAAQFLGPEPADREQPEVLAQGPIGAVGSEAPSLVPPEAKAAQGAVPAPPAPASARAPVAEATDASATDSEHVRLVRALVASPDFVSHYGADAEGLLELAFDLELRLHGAAQAVALLEPEDTSSKLLWRGVTALQGARQLPRAAPLLRRLVDEEWAIAAGKGRRLRTVQADALEPEGGPESSSEGVRVFGSNPNRAWALYCKADPAGALAWVRDQFARAAPGGRTALGERMANHLVTMGLQGEAAATVLGLLDECGDAQERSRLLQRLAGLDPTAAEPILRAQLAEGAPGETNQAREALMDLLARTGRSREALDLLRSLLPPEAAPEAVEWLLSEQSGLLRSLSIEEIERWLGGGPTTADLAEHFVGRHVRDGNYDAALLQWTAVLDRAALGQDPGWLPSVPPRLIQERRSQLEAAARRLEASANENDEVLGDLGDLWVQLGDHHAAMRAYLRAAALDPTDTEWTEALVRIRAHLGHR